MYLSIYNNQSGEEFLRQLGPNESLDLREHVRKWCATYDCEPSFSEPGAHIFNGCGDYQAEIRRTKRATGSCWTCEPFYMGEAESWIIAN